VVTPAARRQAVSHACRVHGVSERRACQVLGVDRSSMRYRSRRQGDAIARQRIRDDRHLSNGNGGQLFTHCVTEPRPLFHQSPPLLEQITARICGPHLVRRDGR
jgi:hypothetical protein